MKPNLKPVFHVVSKDIKNAAKVASDKMREHGIKHALIGGLAVGAYGFVRTTKDVDFLVGEEGFERHPSGLVTLKAGMPFLLGEIPVDSLGTSNEEFLEEAVSSAEESEGIPVIPVEALVLLKLRASRSQDITDIRRMMIESGLINWDKVRNYIEEHDKELVGILDNIEEGGI